VKLKRGRTRSASRGETAKSEVVQRSDFGAVDLAKGAPKSKNEGADNLRKRAQWFGRRRTSTEE
jgi:hypothetical protein